MGSTSRQPGWAAAANPDAARAAFEAWANGQKPSEITSLVLARDYAVMNHKGKNVVEAINRDLRNMVCKCVQGQCRD